MSSYVKKLFLYGILLIAGVTFGMQLAESGNKDTYGSGWNQLPQTQNPQYQVQQSQQVQGQPQGQQQPQLQYPDSNVNGPVSSGSQQWQDGQPITAPADLLLPATTKPSVDRFADKTANLLQQLSKQSIHFVASLFGTRE